MAKYEYGFPADLIAPATIHETKALPTDEAILAYIKTRLPN